MSAIDTMTLESMDSDAEEFSDVGWIKAYGRIGRLRYLAYTMGVSFIYYALLGLIAAGISSSIGDAISMPVLGALFVVSMIPLLILMVSYGRRRLNDMNMSGWFFLLLLIPVIGSIFGLIMIFVPGTSGENDYGPPPPPNTKVTVMLGLLIPFIMLVGILAAVALPAYQDYLEKSRQVPSIETIEALYHESLEEDY